MNMHTLGVNGPTPRTVPGWTSTELQRPVESSPNQEFDPVDCTHV